MPHLGEAPCVTLVLQGDICGWNGTPKQFVPPAPEREHG